MYNQAYQEVPRTQFYMRNRVPGASNFVNINEPDALGNFMNNPLENILKFAKHLDTALQEQKQEQRVPERKSSPAKHAEKVYPKHEEVEEFPKKDNILSYDRCHDDDKYVLIFDIPGVNKEDVKVHLESEGSNTDLLLTVFCVRSPIPGLRTIHSEHRYGSHKRVIQLPKDVDVHSINAKCENGLLIVDIARLKGVQGISKDIMVG